MSGGVDSAVAAARLTDAGHDVIGVTLHLWDYPSGSPEKSRCCAPEDAHDARLVASHLGIPHYTFDRRELFAAEVVEPFVGAYLDGRTPSPCVACNRTVKMRELFALADRLGAAGVATGHYARIRTEGGRTELLRGRDQTKDQSYFLHTLGQAALARLVLPLGDSLKSEVRAEAVLRGLPGANKGESQELCFVPTGRYDTFVAERAGERVRPGPIVDERGRVLGQHGGVHRFTVGQRRGLGVALGAPMFVSAIDAERATVVLGTRDDASAQVARLVDPTFAADVVFPLRAELRVRSQHRGAPAWIEQHGDDLMCRFDEPVSAVSPGQIAVAYLGDRVLGGATIAWAGRELGPLEASLPP
ncbi:MAG: tRNA 2-thiouridine(34) synthase MnmA [Myxococcales bacterium]|nr:tRNA 2-thiouridine(34) synthase MnmA [Myxococcales bacterium]